MATIDGLIHAQNGTLNILITFGYNYSEKEIIHSLKSKQLITAIKNIFIRHIRDIG